MSTTFLLFTLLTIWASTYAQPLPEPPSGSEIQCNADDAGEFCTEIYDPVCVPAPKACFTTPCYQYDTYSNKCEACNALGVTSYTPGQCQYSCDSINLPPPILDTLDNPVCASYQENCQDSSCRETFTRSTIACQDSNVVSFSLGACPDEDSIGEGNLSEEEQQWEEECVLEEELNLWEDQTDNLNEAAVYCDAERPEVCLAIYMPVCVTECLDGECRRTVGNSCTACSDLNVLAYTPGACEAERIQCPFHEPLPTGGFACTLEYAPVCGYSSDCTEEPCGTTAGNACEACSVQAKDYYIRGACDGATDVPL